MLLLIEKLVIDASVLISTLGKPDVFTKKSEEFFRSVATHNYFILPSIAVAEVITNLQKQKMKNINKKIDYIFGLTVIALDTEFLKEFTILSKNPKLKTSDLVISITAKLYDATLITWDKQLLSRSNTICKTQSPKEYIESQKIPTKLL